jgi:hypothetical protein
MLLLLLIVYTLERVAKLEGTLGPWLPLTALDFCLLHAKGLATFAASKRLTFQDGARGGAFRIEMGMARMCPELCALSSVGAHSDSGRTIRIW